MSEQEASRDPILIIRTPKALTKIQRQRLLESFQAASKSMKVDVLVAEDGMEIDVHQDMSLLIQAMQEQTAAINRMAQSNQALAVAIAEMLTEGMDDESPAHTYLDGTPVNPHANQTDNP